MIADARTVAWKELHEIVSRGGTARGRRGLIGAVVFPVLLGLFLGFQAGRSDSFGRGFAVFPVGPMAMGTAAALVTDSVAGERERHTLETLLASPVSDTAILAGKVVAVVGYAWSLALVQLVAVGLASAAGGRLLAPRLLVLVAVLSALDATLAAGFGVQFSLRAPTVRAAARKQAQFAIFMNLIVSGVNVLAVAPVHGVVRPLVLAAAVITLVAVDATLLGVARARFRRGRLLLD